MTNKNKYPPFFMVGIVVCAISYIMADRELFYYGENMLPHNKILQYADVKKTHKKTNAFSNCIRLQDDGLPIIAKETVIRGYSNIMVDTIISYGFDDSVIIVKFMSAERKEYYYIDTPYTYNPTIISADTIGDYLINVFRPQKWICDANHPPLWLTYIRNWSIVIFLLLIVGLGWIIKRNST